LERAASLAGSPPSLRVRVFWSMHLMYYMDDKGHRVYTLKKETPDGKPTESAHPARFSPDDKFSKHRIICKRRFGLLPMQKPKTEL